MGNTSEFKELIDNFHKELLQTRDEVTNIRLSDDKWALKEIIGHLIDSASNNHQRFVRLQLGDLLGFPAYEAEAWIKAQKYIDMDWNVLVALWYNYNLLLLNIIGSIDPAAYKNVWVKGEDAIYLEQLVKEYFEHLELHTDHFKKRQKELLCL